MIVFADADAVRTAHIMEFFGVLGGGQRDAGLDGSGRPANQLAILPGLTHYNINSSPACDGRNPISRRAHAGTQVKQTNAAVDLAFPRKERVLRQSSHGQPGNNPPEQKRLPGEEPGLLTKTVSTLSQVPPSRNPGQIEASGGTCDKVC